MRNWFGLGLVLGLGLVSPAWAVDCAPRPFEERVQYAKTVAVAEMVRYHPASQGKGSQNEMKVLKMLKTDGVAIKSEQTTFMFPEQHGWDVFRYKPGQIVMFFFYDTVQIKCNEPVLLK